MSERKALLILHGKQAPPIPQRI